MTNIFAKEDFRPLLSSLTADPAQKSPPPKKARKSKRHYRAIFISDTHLGTKTARADLLHDFLKSVTCDQLYLVGDIVDGWRLKKTWYWDTLHNDIIRRVLKMAKTGTKVTYVPGNHDEGLRDFTGHDMAGVILERDAIYTDLDGKQYWVLHGDEFDGVVKYAKWLAHVGDWAYTLLLNLNTTFNAVRRALGLPYWSLSAYLKHKVKNAVEYIGKFEEAVADEARRRGMDGVICGHIHHAEIRSFGGITYMNDGDWVESCTALVEHSQGGFEIIYYAKEVAHEEAIRAERKKLANDKEKQRIRARKKAPIPKATITEPAE
ncbi:UDP-2,3-diacylglucosamine hydrolase [Kordiimonas sediminis]|uniref:UDP-2,3-diacylglucosamine hydrolase n=1 Tax=Kordiimonas sediminis TaxID=1735581 RepID=A0A919AJ55_9PROT|nr:UDP-2,3-diacylglucosamine diphosphatase [Kordiimonas sediminis]GHF11171.1 UDP-2,3-diacylglucosamine hydrolase [Kordiimonas sediminis]